MYNLCCIALDIPHSYKTVTAKHFKGREHLFSVYRHNFEVLNHTINYCADNGWGLRVSSSLMPLCTHPDLDNEWDIPSVAPFIKQCADTIKQRKVRISMHPGPFNVLESDNENTVQNTIRELNWHGWLMDQLGAARSRYNPINTHIYTGKGDMMTIAGRFIKNYLRLDDSVKDRLTVENNDKGGMWNCDNLLIFNTLAQEFTGNIPLCYDILHDKCFPSNKSPHECFKAFYDTWGGITPIFHYSESLSGREHSEFPTSKPPEWGWVDWDIELKGKDRAIKML